MTRLVAEDGPWTWGFHPVAFTLSHGWVKNLKPNAMANNTMKYYRIDPEKRRTLREAWNKPRVCAHSPRDNLSCIGEPSCNNIGWKKIRVYKKASALLKNC